MTGFKIERFPFTSSDVRNWGAIDSRHRNWPVVYVISNATDIYVGESLNAENRMQQHLESDNKRNMSCVRVVLDGRFNKSACLDLESFLIQMFSGDGQLQVLNHNVGVTNADYYDRESYAKIFEDIFESFRRQEGLFKRTIPEIFNSDLYKLSPFKALNHDQAIAIEDILEGLFYDLELGATNTVVVQGGPGTGKTIVAIYLLKLLEDIRQHDHKDPLDGDSIFSDFFAPGHPELLESLRFGIVVPQQSLRESISRVFDRTPGLRKDLVLTPFDVGKQDEKFDILIVDEAHRLNQRANQPSAALNNEFAAINQKLFGEDDARLTQLDWIRKQSRHSILMLDVGQSVRPADLPEQATRALQEEALETQRLYRLRSQMRVKADKDYVEYVRRVLGEPWPPEPEVFDDYELRFYDDLGEMRDAIQERNNEAGLARLVAGYAWPWRSKNDKGLFDIEIDGLRLRWNSTQRDWINSAGSVTEVGSIHTVQGYDLNYCGVIIGNDLRYDSVTEIMYFDRAEYHDKKGRENNRKLGIKYSDSDLLTYVQNIYVVLLTRGIRGTFLYVCDPGLREYLRPYFGA